MKSTYLLLKKTEAQQGINTYHSYNFIIPRGAYGGKTLMMHYNSCCSYINLLQKDLKFPKI